MTFLPYSQAEQSSANLPTGTIEPESRVSSIVTLSLAPMPATFHIPERGLHYTTV